MHLLMTALSIIVGTGFIVFINYLWFKHYDKEAEKYKK